MSDEAKKQFNLSMLEGIAQAREQNYSDLVSGTITETNALAKERILRGQAELKANIPLRLIKIVATSKNAGVARYGEPMMRALLKFTVGDEGVALLDELKKADQH